MLRISLILLMAVLVSPTILVAEEPAVVKNESQKFAQDRLMEMARFMGTQDRFGVTMRAGYEVVQNNGQKIEFAEKRQITLARPNHLRVVEVASHGGRDLMLFNGRKITVFDGDTSVFAQARQPGDVDATIMYFVRDLKMRFPLAPMLMERFPDELQRRIQSIEYVEYTDIMGKPAHHIAARTKTVDFQVWIADGMQPLPLRVVLNYPQQEGQPQFWANFSNWNPSPYIDSRMFEFRPPADAQRIVFAAKLMPASTASQPSDAQKQGGK